MDAAPLHTHGASQFERTKTRERSVQAPMFTDMFYGFRTSAGKSGFLRDTE